jgi:type IV pilus assembly protein PilC
MAEYVLKYADANGAVHEKVEEADSERAVYDHYAQQGYLVYSVRPKSVMGQLSFGLFGQKNKLNLDKFLVFNQQFVTLNRAGLPILKSLELMAGRLTDKRLGAYIERIRDDVKKGVLLSEAFRKQGVFPPIYITSIMAGERAGSLIEVLERYIAYQKLTLAVKKKLLVSLIYPCFLILLVFALIVFLVTYVVPNFAQLYESMSTELPGITLLLIAVGTTTRDYILGIFLVVVATIVGLRLWSRTESAKLIMDRWKLRIPIAGTIWIKFQVAQFSRILSTSLMGGIPLVQSLQTSAESLDSRLLRSSIRQAVSRVREGRPLSESLEETGIFPSLAIDMIEVGESTGALPKMLNSVAEFFEDDVNTQMTAALSMIEPVIMIFMGVFVAFVLIALYLPIFSLAETL